MRHRVYLTRSQFRVLIIGLLPLALIATLIPEDVIGDLIGGCFYFPFVYAHSVVHSDGDRTTILWAYYALHLWAGLALLASALKWLRWRPISKPLIAFHSICLFLISAYYISVIATFFAPAIIMPWLHPFQNSRFDPILWMILGSTFTLSVLVPNNVTPYNGMLIRHESPDDPMQDAWFRKLRSVALFLAAKRVQRPLLLVAVAVLMFFGLSLWRITLGRQLVDTAAHGTLAHATLLLRLGADPNIPAYREFDEKTETGDYKITALEEAVDRKSVPMVRALINGGARFRSRSRILETAVANADTEMVRLLLDHCDGPLDSSLLNFAIPQPKLFDLLRARGVDPDVVHGRGHTALCIAAEGGDLKGVKFLLEHGAHINVRDGDGWTAILCAAYTDQREMVRFLYRNGADNSMQCTAIDYGNQQLSMDQAKNTVRETLAGLEKRNGGH